MWCIPTCQLHLIPDAAKSKPNLTQSITTTAHPGPLTPLSDVYSLPYLIGFHRSPFAVASHCLAACAHLMSHALPEHSRYPFHANLTLRSFRTAIPTSSPRVDHADYPFTSRTHHCHLPPRSMPSKWHQHLGTCLHHLTDARESKFFFFSIFFLFLQDRYTAKPYSQFQHTSPPLGPSTHVSPQPASP